MSIFTNGNTLAVTVRGPGKLHLLSYQSNGKIGNVVGSLATTSQGVTKYIISHSYTFERFAFFFDGAGEAVYSIGSGLARFPVNGKNWKEASLVSWGSASVTTGDVEAEASKAVNRDNMITAFIVYQDN
ncbi:hypothetical protein VNI00_017196 [Paramarasmius palmivorus]|uniref:Uncharacterized protein n=1 Tax=Paramarasmius palmivorus TaxID=297713 RepID=A0AAW0B720_9AGAR